MAKVYGLHEIELRPGVRSEDFEKFVIEEAFPAALFPAGWEPMLLRGNRGERDGKYLLMVVIESVEMRDRIAPGPNQFSEEAQRLIDSPEVGKMIEKWGELATVFGQDTVYTDYIVVSS